MRKEIIKYLLMIVVLLSFGSCKKWLDVKPEDKFIERSLFATEQGFIDALNGLYLNISSNSLYGERLPMKIFDVSAQLFPGSFFVNNQYPNGSPLGFTNFTYGDVPTLSRIDSSWVSLYASVTNVSKFLENCEVYSANVSAENLAIYRGEALGVRAYLNFDLLRMFTPNYELDSTAKIIPYVENTGFAIQPYSPSNFILGKILKDLMLAEELLKNDLAVRQSVVSLGNVTTGRSSRNYKMNYYAVKALRARVNLWRGDKVAALATAKELIGVQAKFPWVNKDAQLTNESMSNRVFSSELIFAVENGQLNAVFKRLFNTELSTQVGLITPQAMQDAIFETGDNDYRYAYSWKSEGGMSYRTFVKYRDPPSLNYAFARTVPMLRMGEMYLIAAECEPGLTEGLAYLNQLRNHRGLLSISNTVDINTEIMKEYRREFYGEGQLWFYYKRKNLNSILKSNGVASAMNKGAYTYPVPPSEVDAR